jgi:mono/diheme cytochrome c family protein
MKEKTSVRWMVITFCLAFVFSLEACGKKEEGPMADKGIGPVKSIVLAPIDPQKAARGEEIFKSKCSACHKLDEKYVGPALKGVTQRRSPEWILNQILNPTEMTQKDPIAKELLATHLTQMTPQNLTEDEAKSVLDYFRQVDSQTGKP